jgi:hypothetical protein
MAFSFKRFFVPERSDAFNIMVIFLLVDIIRFSMAFPAPFFCGIDPDVLISQGKEKD